MFRYAVDMSLSHGRAQPEVTVYGHHGAQVGCGHGTHPPVHKGTIAVSSLATI